VALNMFSSHFYKQSSQTNILIDQTEL